MKNATGTRLVLTSDRTHADVRQVAPGRRANVFFGRPNRRACFHWSRPPPLQGLRRRDSCADDPHCIRPETFNTQTACSCSRSRCPLKSSMSFQDLATQGSILAGQRFGQSLDRSNHDARPPALEVLFCLELGFADRQRHHVFDRMNSLPATTPTQRRRRRT